MPAASLNTRVKPECPGQVSLNVRGGKWTICITWVIRGWVTGASRESSPTVIWQSAASSFSMAGMRDPLRLFQRSRPGVGIGNRAALPRPRHSEPRVFRKFKALRQELGQFFWPRRNRRISGVAWTIRNMIGVGPRVSQIAGRTPGQDGGHFLKPLLRRHFQWQSITHCDVDLYLRRQRRIAARHFQRQSIRHCDRLHAEMTCRLYMPFVSQVSRFDGFPTTGKPRQRHPREVSGTQTPG